MTNQENSSPKDASERFKDLLKKAETAEKQAEQLAEEMELQDEPTRHSQVGESTKPSDVGELTEPSDVEKTAVLTRRNLLEDEDIGGKKTLSIPAHEAETAAPHSLELTPPPPLGDTPYTPPPAMDTRGMPLPPRRESTGRASSQRATRSPQRSTHVYKTAPRPNSRVAAFKRWWKRSGPGSWNWQHGMGCFLRMGVLGLFIGVVLAIIVGS
ncbi:MAG: hypothetical protein U9O54_05575, partial [Chloroflexota bacterium]|nr:hypothetical protein [Chloroflexota bacterium]